jgi:flavin-dependent dehydrogenase
LGISRYVLDHLLLSRAKRLGVTVAEGRNVLQARREKAGWAIKYRGPAGDETRHARLLAGADGRHSRIARQLGLDRAVTQPHASIGFQTRLTMTSGLEDSVQIHQFAGGYAGLVRLDADTVNLCFTVEQSLAGKSLSFESLRDNYLHHNPMLRQAVLQGQPRGSLHSIWPVYFPPRKRYGDGFVLVGDAAQVTEPISGEGIYFALRSGQLAAHALSAARRAGEPSLMKLAQYDTACNEEFGARMRLNRCMRIVMRHPVLLGPSLALLRRQMLFDALLRRVCGVEAARHLAHG